MARSLLALLGAGLIATATCASASATTLVLDGASRPRPYQSWIDRAQAA